MLDPLVHAALVTLAAYALKFLFQFLNFPIDEATLNTIAAALVAYILSLFGLAIYRKATQNLQGVLGNHEEYKPPFT